MSMFQKMVEKHPTKYPARMGKKWDDDEVLRPVLILDERFWVNRLQNKKYIICCFVMYS